jgi:hypothetical protein
MPDGEASDTRDELDRSTEITPQWGKLNRGQRFNITALDVHRAIAAAELGKYEAIVFEQAQEESWHEAVKTKKGSADTWPDPRPARLNLHTLAKQLGFNRQRLSEAKQSLLASRIFLPAGGDRVWINKQAEEWIYPKTGLPRLSKLKLDWCAQARPKTQAALPLGDPSKSTVDRALAARSGVLSQHGGPCSCSTVDRALAARSGVLSQHGGPCSCSTVRRALAARWTVLMQHGGPCSCSTVRRALAYRGTPARN